jgi:hypothetical protein
VRPLYRRQGHQPIPSLDKRSNGILGMWPESHPALGRALREQGHEVQKIADLLLMAQRTARANKRVRVEVCDLPLTKGLQESVH